MPCNHSCCTAPTLCSAAEHYGFCLAENPLNRALLPLEAFALRGLQASLKPADAWLHPSGSPCWQLLHQLRLLTAKPQERRQVPSLLALTTLGSHRPPMHRW